jgi:two-component system, sensor histidine kinase and response regulator
VAEDVNILAVDDREENLLALAALLKRPGIRVIEARSGSEALEVLLANDIGLALLDVNMPEMDGFELADLMRGSDRTRSIPIIFLTAAVPDVERLFRGYDAGAVDFLYKPLHPRLLVSKVEVFAQLHRQKRQLANQLEQIKHAQAMSDIFVGVLGHDLRNPLANIATSAVALERLADESSDTMRLTRIIQRASNRMNRLTQQVLDFARARVKGGIPVQVADVDVGKIARSLIADLEDEAAGRITLDITGEPLGRLDEDRLTQVIANLLNNALEHGLKGATIVFRIDGTARGEFRLAVHNEGAIPPDTLAVLFAPFKPRKSGAGGAGLGLYIVDQIVRSHGGRVSVHSTIEEGTTFYVVLPRNAASSGDGADPAP